MIINFLKRLHIFPVYFTVFCAVLFMNIRKKTDMELPSAVFVYDNYVSRKLKWTCAYIWILLILNIYWFGWVIIPDILSVISK